MVAWIRGVAIARTVEDREVPVRVLFGRCLERMMRTFCLVKFGSRRRSLRLDGWMGGWVGVQVTKGLRMYTGG
jgi:hypothetical protein